MTGRLTPVDILNLRFRRQVRGYSRAAVDETLRRAAAEIETLLSEAALQKERAAGLERELAQYKVLESTLRDAILVAQKAADETRQAARMQADALLQEAQTQARQIESETQNRLADAGRHIETLQQERRRLARDLHARLSAQIAWLDGELSLTERDTA